MVHLNQSFREHDRGVECGRIIKINQTIEAATLDAQECLSIASVE